MCSGLCLEYGADLKNFLSLFRDKMFCSEINFKSYYYLNILFIWYIMFRDQF